MRAAARSLAARPKCGAETCNQPMESACATSTSAPEYVLPVDFLDKVPGSVECVWVNGDGMPLPVDDAPYFDARAVLVISWPDGERTCIPRGLWGDVLHWLPADRVKRGAMQRPSRICVQLVPVAAFDPNPIPSAPMCLVSRTRGPAARLHGLRQEDRVLLRCARV
jgi:hypothetical protein